MGQKVDRWPQDLLNKYKEWNQEVIDLARRDDGDELLKPGQLVQHELVLSPCPEVSKKIMTWLNGDVRHDRLLQSLWLCLGQSKIDDGKKRRAECLFNYIAARPNPSNKTKDFIKEVTKFYPIKGAYPFASDKELMANLKVIANGETLSTNKFVDLQKGMNLRSNYMIDLIELEGREPSGSFKPISVELGNLLLAIVEILEIPAKNYSAPNRNDPNVPDDPCAIFPCFKRIAVRPMYRQDVNNAKQYIRNQKSKIKIDHDTIDKFDSIELESFICKNAHAQAKHLTPGAFSVICEHGVSQGVMLLRSAEGNYLSYYNCMIDLHVFEST